MTVLVTGSSGHLGEALVRTLQSQGREVVGLDIVESGHTQRVGSIADRQFVRDCMGGATSVIHAATLHKPHVATHDASVFIETNVMGTQILLEEASAAGVERFVFTSTTSAFGAALTPRAGEAAVWVTEQLAPVPRNIYGVTKVAAEDLCQLQNRQSGLPCVILRTSRFFPEEDDNAAIREGYADANAKVNEFLYRRVDIEDVVSAHLCAMERADDIGFGKYIISATTPFRPGDLIELGNDASAVTARYFPDFPEVYRSLGWKMFPTIERVYVNDKARRELGWAPRYDFGTLLKALGNGQEHTSALARQIGIKGYHNEEFKEGPYPVRAT